MGEVAAFQKPISKLVLEIRGHVHDAGRAETTCAKHQLQAGVRLIELRARIEAGEEGKTDWWAWYETQFVGHIKSRKYAEKLMKWARADDPEAAMEADKSQVRDAVRAMRDRSGVYVNSNENQEVNDDLVGKALRLVEKMTPAERERFDGVYQERFR